MVGVSDFSGVGPLAEGDQVRSPEPRQRDVVHTRGCISNQATDTYLWLSHVTAWSVGQPNSNGLTNFFASLNDNQDLTEHLCPAAFSFQRVYIWQDYP